MSGMAFTLFATYTQANTPVFETAYLDIRLMDCALEVWLNGIPLQRGQVGPDMKSISLPVSEFLVANANMLTVAPFPGASPSTTRKLPVVVPSANARFRVRERISKTLDSHAALIASS
jgi:hypothetical protein